MFHSNTSCTCNNHVFVEGHRGENESRFKKVPKTGDFCQTFLLTGRGGNGGGGRTSNLEKMPSILSSVVYFVVPNILHCHLLTMVNLRAMNDVKTDIQTARIMHKPIMTMTNKSTRHYFILLIRI